MPLMVESLVAALVNCMVLPQSSMPRLGAFLQLGPPEVLEM